MESLWGGRTEFVANVLCYRVYKQIQRYGIWLNLFHPSKGFPWLRSGETAEIETRWFGLEDLVGILGRPRIGKILTVYGTVKFQGRNLSLEYAAEGEGKGLLFAARDYDNHESLELITDFPIFPAKTAEEVKAAIDELFKSNGGPV